MGPSEDFYASWETNESEYIFLTQLAVYVLKGSVCLLLSTVTWLAPLTYPCVVFQYIFSIAFFCFWLWLASVNNIVFTLILRAMYASYPAKGKFWVFMSCCT